MFSKICHYRGFYSDIVIINDLTNLTLLVGIIVMTSLEIADYSKFLLILHSVLIYNGYLCSTRFQKRKTQKSMFITELNFSQNGIIMTFLFYLFIYFTHKYSLTHTVVSAITIRNIGRSII